MTAPIVVIGVGNPYRRDDGVGPAVVDLLRDRRVDATLVDSDGEAAGLIAAWEERRLAILVDAVRAEPAHPGRIHRLVVPHLAAERARAASSHGIDLGESVELARELERLPSRMVIFAIEAADTGFGRGLTPAVRAAAERVTNEIAAEIAAERAWESVEMNYEFTAPFVVDSSRIADKFGLRHPDRGRARRDPGRLPHRHDMIRSYPDRHAGRARRGMPPDHRGA